MPMLFAGEGTAAPLGFARGPLADLLPPGPQHQAVEAENLHIHANASLRWTSSLGRASLSGGRRAESNGLQCRYQLHACTKSTLAGSFWHYSAVRGVLVYVYGNCSWS
mmetsp:Transcript_15382/g.38169  ORF Transcript_15382/g.38169 Transcript_15382/m.38169 type:complete len:108 (+) Transcript_15382:765-1088(+)